MPKYKGIEDKGENKMSIIAPYLNEDVNPYRIFGFYSRLELLKGIYE